MQKYISQTGIKPIAAVLCFATTAVFGSSPSFYGPTGDPIPYTPGETSFGPNYEIPAAPWKTEADQRIETLRKAELNIRVVDQQGNPLNSIPVRVELMRHDFYWGAVVNSGFLNEKHNENLKSYFLKYFNSAGIANGLKPKQCPIPPCQESFSTFIYRAAENQMDWFKKHGIPVRGHALTWEGERWLAKKLRNIFNQPSLSDHEKGQKMFYLQSQHLDHAVKKWDVFCWDVVNEPRDNRLINDLLPGKNTFVEWFRQAGLARKKYNRNLKLYYNENQIISFVKKTGSFEANRDVYKTRIKELLDAGVPIDGIGMQYRFRRYIAPEEVYRRLCEFEEFNLPYQATEFEVKPMLKNEPFSVAEKKKMTAELLTVFFSHPNATGLWHWSFMDDRKGGYPDALFSYNGQPRPEAEQWIKMMEEDFNTNVTLRTAKNGAANVRGFKGVYKVTIGQGPKAKTSIITLKDKTNLKLVY